MTLPDKPTYAQCVLCDTTWPEDVMRPVTVPDDDNGGQLTVFVCPECMVPCPACEGSGRRIVTPERPHGSRKGPQVQGKSHGTESTYTLGCRCVLCRAAHRTGTERRRLRASR